MPAEYEIVETLYENALTSPEDIADFRLEGSANISFPQGRMRMENALDAGEGQKANFVLWCPETFPDGISVSWEFWPVKEPGLCILFFCAAGRNGIDMFDPGLEQRVGVYDQYHHGDIDAYHISYYRRLWEEERSFHTCNLRKSYGFHLTAQGADPLPSVMDARGPYRMRLLVNQGEVLFSINDLSVLKWKDDGTTYGPILQKGRIGFRQMAPLIAEYRNLKVESVRKINVR
ncbi:YesU family protein [Paenibacillus sedimenti]|uniref:YesU family protein n=1 Tax=Paenibacillus sedimenti TaxID=2770274 RepID=UPI001CB6D5CD|nr:YesU family protein [Paenibacillus sedimenti]